MSTGNVLRILNTDRLGRLGMALPPVEEAITIAAFLDHETGKIDALVEEQRQLIALLREKRQAVISHAVTKGLDPNAPMKDSGVEWLGEVPEHWSATPLKYLVSLRSGGTPSKNAPEFWDGDIPWVSARDLKKEVINESTYRITDYAITSGAASCVNAGSVLVLVRGMTLAKAFPVCVISCPMAINQDLKALNGRGEVENLFLAWTLRGLADESLARIDEAGHGTKALRMEAWTSMHLPRPSLIEQASITAFLDHETEKIDALIKEAGTATALLQERRSALISAAVTGKIDVRDWANKTPEAA